jgi:predicted nucleotidyltransferase
METRSIEAVVRALNAHNVRYLIVGGLAVVAHGYARFTADLDLFLDLEEENLRRAVASLSQLGYRPRAPVEFVRFVDPDTRATWIRDKGLTVFSLFSPQHAATEIDLFAEAPLVFQDAYASAVRMEVAPGAVATFIGLEDLIALKTRAGRPQDVHDVERLRSVRGDVRDG